MIFRPVIASAVLKSSAPFMTPVIPITSGRREATEAAAKNETGRIPMMAEARNPAVVNAAAAVPKARAARGPNRTTSVRFPVCRSVPASGSSTLTIKNRPEEEQRDDQRENGGVEAPCQEQVP